MIYATTPERGSQNIIRRFYESFYLFCLYYYYCSISQHFRRSESSLFNTPSVPPPALQPSLRWSRYTGWAHDFISTFSTELAAIEFALTPGLSGFDHRGPIDPNGEWIEANYKALLITYPKFSQIISELEDSPANPLSLSGIRNEKLITNTLFFDSTFVFECLNFLRPNVVCEIGGGYGAPAYIWLTNKIYQPSTYIDIDYPSSLFFAEVYLKSSLPNAHFIYIDSIEKVQSLSSLDKTKQTIVLCPLQHAEWLLDLPIDLVTNTGSLAEMSEAAVEFWMNWVEKSKTSHFYSCNAFCYPLNDLKQSTNFYAPQLSSNWKVLAKKVDYEMPWFYLHTACEMVSMLVERGETDESMKEEMKKNYWASLSNCEIFTRKTFLEAMDIIRVTQDEQIALNVFSSVAKSGVAYVDPTIELSYPYSSSAYLPKEVLFLAQWLLSKNYAFEPSVLEEISQLKDRFFEIYEIAPQGTP